eukprot:NODE_2591_length_908_cov_323.173505.p1 GENE.NODE_2591_length_908_cov_323.173505~~NODE_2591_length_908_cov_323.173505.p1  ORF type:complete len:205 (-),score=65.39 NODE_2591_length_908_cov_323.173505:210-824(-)
MVRWRRPAGAAAALLAVSGTLLLAAAAKKTKQTTTTPAPPRTPKPLLYPIGDNSYNEAWLTPEMLAAVDKLGRRDASCLACEWVSKLYRTTLWPAIKANRKTLETRRTAFLDTVDRVCDLERYPRDLSVVVKGGKVMMTDWREEQLKPTKRQQMSILKTGAMVQTATSELCTSLVLAHRERLADIAAEKRTSATSTGERSSASG